MPVIPSNSNGLTPNKGGNSQRTSSGESAKESKKATAMDYLSKGPQIPDRECRSYLLLLDSAAYSNRDGP